MSRQNENKRAKESLSPDQVDAILLKEADNLDLIAQDTQNNTTTLTSEDRSDVIQLIDEEHHQIFLSMNAIRGVDVDDLCEDEDGEEGGEGDNQR
jgi:hypothetical protein